MSTPDTRTPTPPANAEQRARELLAASWVRAGWPAEATQTLVTGDDTQMRVVLSAIVAAFTHQPEASKDRLAVRMLVAAGYVAEAKANEALHIAHGFARGPLPPKATMPEARGVVDEALVVAIADHVRKWMGPIGRDLAAGHVGTLHGAIVDGIHAAALTEARNVR